MTMLCNADAIGAGGYQIDRSLRFRASASASLSRTTPASGGDRDKSWIYFHFKRATLGVLQYLHGADTVSADAVYFNAGDKLCVDIAGTNRLVSTQVFRDPAAHGAFLAVMDAANATAALKYRVYYLGNGSGTFTEITAWDTDTRSSIAAGTAKTMHNSIAHVFGKNPTAATNYADGYLSEHRIGTWSGSPPTPASFGGISATTGLWEPRGNSASYGTSGSYLNFNDPTSTPTLCADRSGNGNNWTANNISLTAGATYDWMIDSPTNGASATQPVGNYPVFNILQPGPAPAVGGFSSGNLNVAWGASHGIVRSTVALPTNGKFYFEMFVVTSTSGSVGAGINLTTASAPNTGAGPVAGEYGTYYYTGANLLYNNGVQTNIFPVTVVAGDILQCAVDVGASKVWFGVNNVWSDGTSSGTTGNPTAGTNPTINASGADLFPGFRGISNAAHANFGQRPFAYTPPAGFKALCTANLP
jgi:hypothetical protein